MEHRKLLLQNHHLSPEVVSTCSNDIEKYCRNNEVSRRTIHCLMDHSKPSRQKNRIDKACQKSVCVFLLYIESLLFLFYVMFLIIISYKSLCALQILAKTGE